MRIAYFPKQTARNAAPVLQSLLDSCRASGISTVQDDLDADAVILWSVLWTGRMASNKRIYDHYNQAHKPIIVIDIGSLQRGHTWKIALNNINGEGWFGDDIGLDPDRPAKLKLRRQSPGGHDILIATQHRSSLQARMIESMEEWVMDKIRAVRSCSDRKIVVRPHPRDRLNLPTLPVHVRVEQPKKISGTYDSFDWHDDYHAIINHNSGPGVLAAIAGVRPVVDTSSLAWPVSIRMQDIERSYDVDRESWLIRIAHTEYTLDEIAQGRWLKRLGPRL